MSFIEIEQVSTKIQPSRFSGATLVNAEPTVNTGRAAHLTAPLAALKMAGGCYLSEGACVLIICARENAGATRP